MSTNVDARGLPCPQPVIATKKALDAILGGGSVTTIVDNAVAKENVIKFATASGFGVCVEDNGGQYSIRITKSGVVEAYTEGTGTKEVVYLITKNTLGQGSEELGSVLMRSFLFTLSEGETVPKTVLLINSGVLLAVNGSPVLELVKTLVGRGVNVLSCGTCLDYFKVKEQLAVGEVTNMYTIITEMEQAAKAITL